MSGIFQQARSFERHGTTLPRAGHRKHEGLSRQVAAWVHPTPSNPVSVIETTNFDPIGSVSGSPGPVGRLPLRAFDDREAFLPIVSQAA